MTYTVRIERRVTAARVFNDYRPAILGVTLSSMMLLQVIGQGAAMFIQTSSVLALVVISLVALSYRPTNNLNSTVVTIIVALGLLIVVGTFRASEILGTSVFFRAGGVLLFLSLGVMLARRKEHALLERAFPIYAVTFVAVLIYVLIDNDRHWERLRGHLHSNLWAFVAATAVVGILVARISVFFRLALIGFVFYMISMEFQARGPLIWAVITTLFFAIFYSLKDFQKSKNPLLYLSTFFVIFVLSASGIIVTIDFLLFEILQVDSATRGIGSGLTGRGQLWSEFFALFSERPLFGYGFDMSRYVAEHFLAHSVAGDISSTHNSYLTILFDLGLIGFTLYFLLLIMMVVGVIRSGRIELVPFVIVFLLSGLTESRPLNVGNPSGLLFIILIPYCAASAFGASRKRVNEFVTNNNARPAGNVTS
jgi:O-antigen ligase